MQTIVWTAFHNKGTYRGKTVNAVLRDFYMDDLLKSFSSEKEAVVLALQLIDLLPWGGFRLTKFMSSSRNVLAQLPPAEILNTPGISLPFD